MLRETLSSPLWHYERRASEDELRPWCAELDLPPLVIQILKNRGLTLEEARAFLDEADTAGYGEDPYLFRDMPRAIARIKQALAAHEHITVYGDYDVDGICGTALLVIGLRALGAHVDHYIPHRMNEGYGLHAEALTRLNAQGSRLVITVDCGVMGHNEVDHARGLGIDVIITDHHRSPHDEQDYPKAVAVLHSSLGSYPNPDLTGSGVAWKLLIALVRELGADFDVYRMLDLVSLGAVCDVAPIRGENRMLVRQGLKLLRSSERRLGINALLEAARIDSARLNTGTIGFTIGPRLNAAGRIESPEIAYRLLVCENPVEAEALAEQLDQLNRQRQGLVRTLEAEIETELGLHADHLPPLIWIERPDIPIGIAGLIAGNFSRRYYRPAVVIERGEDFSRGSARSVEEVDIMKALDRCAPFMERYGGHATAAGLGVNTEKLPLLRAHLTEACAGLLAGDARPCLHIDAKVRLATLNPQTYDALQRLQPFGQGNPEPLFASHNLQVMNVDRMGNGKHLRLRVNDGYGTTIRAVGWNMGNLVEQIQRGSLVNIAYTLEENSYNGMTELRMNIADIQQV